MTDVELSQKISDDVANEYITAIEFIEVAPNHSLGLFRNILSNLCDEIALYNKVELTSNTTYKKIKQLYNEQVIEYDFKEMLHSLRLYGNKGVHKTYKIIKNSDEFIKDSIQKPFDDAKNSRKIIIDIFKNTLLCLGKKINFETITYIKIAEQEYKQIIFDAMTSPSSSMKLKAGMIYESIAKNEYLKNIMYINEEQLAHVQGLYQCAAASYQSSFKISAEVDKKLHDKRTIEDIVYQDCNLEALYKYSRILSENKDGRNQKEIGYKYLKIASDRGHPEATAYYALYLYNVKKYKEAFEYLNRSYIQNIPLVHRLLCKYYSNKEINLINKKLALKHINKAIELNCSDSLLELGEAYHKGSFVEKDKILAEKYLIMAMERGNINAQKYYFFQFKDGSKKIAKLISTQLKNSLSVHTNNNQNGYIKKIPRNSLCKCGSGKKYKNCCDSKIS